MSRQLRIQTLFGNVHQRSSWSSGRSAAKPLGPARFPRLNVEHLEDRRVLAAVAWDGGAGTPNWNDAVNWSNDVLPSSTDDVTINVVGSDANILLAGQNAKIRSLNSQEGVSIDPGTSLSLLGGSSSVQGALDNSGALHVQSSTVTLSRGSTSSGTFTVDAGAVLNFQGGPGSFREYSLAGEVSGAGDVFFQGNVSATVSGLYNVTGNTFIYSLFSTSTLNFTNVQSVGAELVVSADQNGAVVNFYQNNGTAQAPLHVTNLTLQIAALTSGPIDAANFDWISGTVKGTGDLNVTGDLQLSVPINSPGDLTLHGRSLNSAGTATWQTGGNQGRIHLINGAMFNNAGTLDVKSLPGTGNLMDGDGTFNNMGTLIKTTGLNPDSGFVIYVALVNSGSVHVQSSSVILVGGSTSTGTFTVDAGTHLEVQGVGFTQTAGNTILHGGDIYTSTPLAIQGGQLSGGGNIFGSVFNGGTTSPGFGLDSPGLISVTGNYAQSSVGALSMEIGGPAAATEHDQLQVTGAVTLDGELDVSLFNGFVPNLADEFMAITNEGSDAVVGQFESSVLTVGTSQFMVSYVGGDGNDVALTATRANLNHQPTVAIPIPHVTVNEDAANTEVNLSGTFTDADIPTNGDTLSLSIVANNNAALVHPSLVGNSLTLDYLANQSGLAQLTLRATDSHGAFVDATLDVTVNAVNDTPVGNGQSVSVSEDGAIAIALSASDVETAAAHLSFRVTSLPTSGVLFHGANVVEVGDKFTGAPSLVFEPAAGCVCSSPETFTFAVTDRGDPDNASGATVATSAPATVTINITSAVASGAVAVSGGILRVGGTSSSDIIAVSRQSANLIVHLNSSTFTVPAAGITEIRAWGRAGHDTILLCDLAINTMIDGGTGNDLLMGGSAKDLIFGGDGIDILTGGAGSDMLIGGDGADLILGGSGHDVLVAGDVGCHFTDDMLRDAAANWAASRTNDEGADDDTLDESVIDDNFDILTGGNGADWFIVGCGDLILDFTKQNKDGDVVTIF